MDYTRQTIIKRTCYMLLNNHEKGWHTISQATMKKMRVSFASSFVGKGKEFVFVSGGFSIAR